VENGIGYSLFANKFNKTLFSLMKEIDFQFIESSKFIFEYFRAKTINNSIY
jgi:hypothetical protein